jgi:hypothetical protein
MYTFGLGKVFAFGLGQAYGEAAPQPVVQEIVIDVMSDVTWPLVVDLTGDEQKRKDYDGTKRSKTI